MYQDMLSMKDVLNYNYCKRIVYFEHVLHIPQVTTVKELEGRKKDAAESAKVRRTKVVGRLLPKLEKRLGLFLHSEELGLQTKLDCLLVDEAGGIAYPVQFKNSAKPPAAYRSAKFQLIAESLLVENVLKLRAPKAFIKFLKDGEIMTVETGEEEKRALLQQLNEINTLIKLEHMPEPTKFLRRCEDCCYHNRCRRA